MNWESAWIIKCSGGPAGVRELRRKAVVNKEKTA